MAQAFAGLKVVDFSQVISGPLAAQQLAHLGAEVIKVEPLKVGDQMRGLLTNNETSQKRLAPAYLTINIGKKSLAIDLKNEAARPILDKLLSGADIVVQNFRVGVAKRLGIDYDAVKAINPNVIYCSISGYGQTGPRSPDAAYDGAIQAMAGLMALNGHESTGPTRTQYLPVDTMTGMTAAFSIAAAVARRERTGEGQNLDVSMLDCAMLLGAAHVANYTMMGEELELFGNGSPAKYPASDSFKTSDGHIMITAFTNAHAMAVFEVLGLHHLVEDPRFQTPEGRRDHMEEIQEQLKEVFPSDTSKAWAEKLQARGIALAIVNKIPDAIEDEQFEHRTIFSDIDGIEGMEGTFRLVGAPFMADADGPEVSGPPPGIVGQHNAEVLESLGYSADDIEQMKADGLFG